MASTWGGTTIPAPTKYERSAAFVGSQYIVSDGSMVTDYVADKTVIDLEFAGITNTERGTVVGKFLAYASSALVVGSETSENVIPVAGSLRVTLMPGGTRAYIVSGQVRTV